MVVVSIACAMFAGCGTPSADPTPQDHPMANAPVRTDLEPLRTHFPRLGRMVTAHWQGRAVGRGSWVPGPSDVLVQALAVLDPTDLQSIAAGYTWDRASIHWDARLTDQLRPFLPVNGDWRWCEQFEAAVRTSRYSGEVYVDLRSGTVYLNVSTT